MYFVNREQIDQRLEFISIVVEALQSLPSANQDLSLLDHLAQERALHLAIETVTDIGSFLIDAFIMRDPSSYEDILEILRDEQVCSEQVGETLKALVQLRRPLVQAFFEWKRDGLHPIVLILPETLTEFKDAVEKYLQQEL